MKTPVLSLLVLVVCGGILICVFLLKIPSGEKAGPASQEAQTTSSNINPSSSALHIPKEQKSLKKTFASYGEESGSIAEDLQLLDAAVRFLQVTGTENQLFGMNRNITKALCGGDPETQIWDPNHPMISQAGELFDRWGTPISFHDVSRSRIDIISAGPDKIIGNEDDMMAIEGKITSRKSHDTNNRLESSLAE